MNSPSPATCMYPPPRSHWKRVSDHMEILFHARTLRPKRPRDQVDQVWLRKHAWMNIPHNACRSFPKMLPKTLTAGAFTQMTGTRLVGPHSTAWLSPVQCSIHASSQYLLHISFPVQKYISILPNVIINQFRQCYNQPIKSNLKNYFCSIRHTSSRLFWLCTVYFTCL